MKIPLISLKNKNIKNDDEKMMKIYTKHVIDKKNYWKLIRRRKLKH